MSERMDTRILIYINKTFAIANCQFEWIWIYKILNLFKDAENKLEIYRIWSLRHIKKFI